MLCMTRDTLLRLVERSVLGFLVGKLKVRFLENWEVHIVVTIVSKYVGLKIQLLDTAPNIFQFPQGKTIVRTIVKNYV